MLTQTVSQTITGNLQSMDFGAHKMTILFPLSHRILECSYNEEIEPELWKTRRGPVQVTGTVVMDADGLPESIQNVENIRPLDLSDFVVREVVFGNSMLRFANPLVLTPELSESQQYMTLRYEPLDIDVIAATREDLWAELREQIAMLWQEYALEDDARLAPPAIELKKRLRAAIE